MKIAMRMACLLVAIGFSTGGLAAGPPAGLGVRVLNTPLPVTGTVNVGPVNITGTVPIRDIENPARQPYQNDEILSTPAGLLGDNATFTVPSDKRLVIEFVSFSANWPAGQYTTRFFIGVCNAAGGTCPTSYYVAPSAPVAEFGGEVFSVGSSPVRLYADPGTEVTVGVRRNATTGEGLASVSVSGYLVDVQQ